MAINMHKKHVFLRSPFSLLRLSSLVAGAMLSSATLASDINLNYAFFAPAQTFPGVQMQFWADELAKRTDGKVTVSTFPGGSLLSASNMLDGVLNGVADIGLTTTSYEPARFPLLNLIGDLSGIEVNAEVASQVAYQLVQEYPLEQFGLEEFKVITVFTSEPGYLQTREQVSTLEDLSGREIRVPGESDTLRTLGAVPIGMSQAETGEALQAGIVQGVASSRETLMDLQYARYLDYIVDYPLSNVVMLAVMSRQRWESLPEDVQQVIDELGAEASQYAGHYLDNHVREAITWAQDNHNLEIVTLSDAEQKRWAGRIEPLNEQRIEQVAVQGLPAGELYDRMLALIEQYQQ
ncbi:TRAP transporter substrate-binding protein [Halomonas venusta]|uniref:TRAP transporter substrate-binding protein n=1 Tax=Vreelandella venusta TaxID=44935 RepID=UPI00295E2C4E|nr:TRAP transporter substrate-binding protein [Halomonas venusta]MDW0361156.1 TRAP transporter substrate-binding protein [Halomonas venusta]